MRADYEVMVVGGGPAGSTISALLADLGHRVLLLEKARFPRFKACSDYINPAGAQLLEEMGIQGEALQLGARQMDGMIVHAPNGNRFVANYARAQPGMAALGISRQVLDNLLLNRARDHGVEIVEQAHVRRIVRDGLNVSGVVATIDGVEEEVRARIVVGADGRHSVVRRDLGLEVALRWPRKTGLVAHYRGVSRLDRMGEMHVGRGVYGGLAMIEDGMVNLTIVAPSSSIRDRAGSVETFFEDSIGDLPWLAESIEGAERVDDIRGVGAMASRARRVAGDGFVLVGDAASFLDPFAGEGVYEALEGAKLAAPFVSAALRSGDTSAAALDGYRIARRKRFAAKRTVSWIVQGFINTPAAMNYITPRLASRDGPGLTLSGVLGNFEPASKALSPFFLAKLLRP